jgi:hypothetical protein
MPKECRIMLGEDKTLLDICLYLHMNNTGSSDPLPDDIEVYYIKILKTAINNWEPSHNKKFEEFDNAVLNLINKTILESLFSRMNRNIV